MRLVLVRLLQVNVRHTGPLCDVGAVGWLGIAAAWLLLHVQFELAGRARDVRLGVVGDRVLLQTGRNAQRDVGGPGQADRCACDRHAVLRRGHAGKKGGGHLRRITAAGHAKRCGEPGGRGRAGAGQFTSGDGATVARRLEILVADADDRQDRAAAIGLDKSDAFSPRQYRLFVTGKGKGGQAAPAKLVDQSVRILTNTRNRPLWSNVNGVLTPTVLASYGLMVNEQGLLESPANTTAPTRQVNAVIEPGGYLGTWCRANGATDSLRALYRSAYTSEAVFGNAAQQGAGAAQLVPNQKGAVSSTVGMSMAPSIWVVNFALIYVLSPTLAARMPARWTPIPPAVASAIAASPSGQVPYSEYASLLRSR